MVSRVGVLCLLACLVGMTESARAGGHESSATTPIYVVQHDPRLCPSPLCGGYWVALANGARTRCTDEKRHARCYVASAVRFDRRPLAVAIPDGGLVRAKLDLRAFEGVGRLGILRVEGVYAPAGNVPVSGGYYRVVDTGVRCIRAPCFSYRATQVNGPTRTVMSDVDLRASGATSSEIARATAAMRTSNGLFARGRFATTPDGGRSFRATRLYLSATPPRA